MELDFEKLTQARKIALDTAKKILNDFGVNPNSKEYPSRVYEMQFKIYHIIKDDMNLKSE